jgi:hypothetical protein
MIFILSSDPLREVQRVEGRYHKKFLWRKRFLLCKAKKTARRRQAE